MKGFELTKEMLKTARKSTPSPIDELARRLNRSRSFVEKICQEPPTDEYPEGNGLPNPIDQMDEIFEFMLLHCPQMAEVLIGRYATRLARHRELQQPARPLRRREQIKRFFAEWADVMEALTANDDPEVLHQQWQEAQVEFFRLIGIVPASTPIEAGSLFKH